MPDHTPSRPTTSRSASGTACSSRSPSWGCTGSRRRPAVEAAPARARAAITARLRACAPHGLGSYVFWTRADEDRLDDLPGLPLHTSGPEVNRAVVAALAHHGLTARPGPRPGMLLVG